MPAVCRADVEALLRTRKLDRTLVPVMEAGAAPLAPPTLATGVPELDRQLGGGFPVGQFSEVVGPRSSGRTSLLMSLLSAATARGELVALVDTFDRFDPESAASAGVDLPRMLWVRGDACAPVFPSLAHRQTGTDRVISRALKATNLILQSGGFGVIALDLADAPPQALRRVPMTTWLRFQRVLEGQEAVGVIVGSAPMSRSAGGVSMSLHRRQAEFPPSPAFAPRTSSGFGGTSGVPAFVPSPAWGLRRGERDSGSVFHGFESDVRTARARLVPGTSATPVRLRASA